MGPNDSSFTLNDKKNRTVVQPDRSSEDTNKKKLRTSFLKSIKNNDDHIYEKYDLNI